MSSVDTRERYAQDGSTPDNGNAPVRRLTQCSMRLGCALVDRWLIGLIVDYGGGERPRGSDGHTKRSGASGRAKSSTSRATGIPAGMMEGVQQIWLAGMGALARAQRDGPAAFHDAVTEGLKLLERSRSGAGQLVRDAIDTAQGSMQARIDSAMSQANETWDSLETLFQNRVQRALMQIGVPTAEEVRKLTRRVAELNESVKALSRRQATPRKRGTARAGRATRGSTRRRRRA